MFKHKKMFKHKNVQTKMFKLKKWVKNIRIFLKNKILKMFRIFKKEKNEKIKIRQKKTEENNKTRKKRKKKPHEKKKNLANAALTGRPNFAPTRAEQSSAPLTGGA
jgi:hypothetical protein